MLLDSFPYLDYLKLDHCYLLPISLPELFVSSHGGTMTMSLMHQWHNTICGGVISARHSLLYGAYGCILAQDSNHRGYDQKGYDGRSYDRQGGNSDQKSRHNRERDVTIMASEPGYAR
ncbi:hypothetical protein Tco_0912502 [Tanacetum coccineum]